MSVVERALQKLRGTPIEGDRRRATSAPYSQASIGMLTSPEDLAAHGPVITVDRNALRAAGYLPETDLDRRFADEYRGIKRALIAATHAPRVQAPNPRLIMMASALPGDGKTFTSINLALSMARERDHTVLLVDADTPKPHVSRIFGVDNAPGLLDAAAGDAADLEPFIMPTDVRGLSILPAGSVREGATELLASARMASLVNRLVDRDPGRLVLFDSPPLLVSSESWDLARIVGQVVLVVRAGKTPRQAVIDALEGLGDDKAVSFVLNQGRRSLAEGIYGYGGYGSYGENAESSQQA